MKRVLAISAVFALVLFGAPSPASAAQECETSALGLVCLDVVNGQATVSDALGNPLVSLPVPPVVERVTETVTIPGPTITVPGPTQTITVTPPRPPQAAPATATVTRTASGSTATVTATQSGATLTAAPTTVTTTQTPGRQSSATSGTLATTTVTAVPPVRPPDKIDLLPDTPTAAAATGSIFGLFVGLAAAFALMFIAYRRGQVAGEEATLKEFLGYIRGEPQPGRHRAN